MEKQKELVFITVIGQDRKGVVASISGYLYRKDVNIVDINQRIMTDGYFVMSMAVDAKAATVSMTEMSRELDQVGRELGMQVQIQHENVFRMMHRI
ncbi:MAG: ACT domain-containing protein [Desulfobacterales bacterium]|nr:ACT domain-containing protein [Desulfobacterales bacterium]MBS3754612.1 ACT domain-containing protein [Desulfobacterales bacterium]